MVDRCGISRSRDGWSVWYGSVLVDRVMTRVEATHRLREMLLREMERAKAEVAKANDHLTFVMDETQRIAEDGPDISAPEGAVENPIAGSPGGLGTSND